MGNTRSPFARLRTVAPLVVTLVALSVASGASPAQAAAPASTMAHVLHSLPASSRVFGEPTSTVHYLYADDGICTGQENSDGITIFSVQGTTLTSVGQVSIGCNYGLAYGAHALAVVKKNTTHGACLLYADLTFAKLDSLALTSPASPSLVSSISTTGNAPEDIEVYPNQNLAYVQSPGSGTDIFSIGAGCALTAIGFVNDPSGSNTKGMAILNSSLLATIDWTGAKIYTYTINSSGGMTLLNTTNSQYSYPAAVVAGGAHIFVGSDSNNVEMQAGNVKATGSVAFFHGSPQNLSTAYYGDAVYYDSTDKLLVQGSQYTGGLIWYTVNFTTRTMAYGGVAYEANTSSAPINFARLGGDLFVGNIAHGDVEACAISSSGISGCTSVATLPDGSTSNGGAIALF